MQFYAATVAARSSSACLSNWYEERGGLNREPERKIDTHWRLGVENRSFGLHSIVYQCTLHTYSIYKFVLNSNTKTVLSECAQSGETIVYQKSFRIHSSIPCEQENQPNTCIAYNARINDDRYLIILKERKKTGLSAIYNYRVIIFKCTALNYNCKCTTIFIILQNIKFNALTPQRRIYATRQFAHWTNWILIVFK